ncbi:flavonol synthase/flavanone 3-hydroxylase-like [Aristolochia californica]|uniref:flavonol synthase/flavanone 3-hydroxylase-like n=1 Tax=Aristolochia californica TaxID=171875 RepID=UPI0035DE2F9A
MAGSCIPTVNLSSFFVEGNKEGKKNAKKIISDALSDLGFFQIIDHGVPLDLMDRALELSKRYFQYPDEEKLKSKPIAGSKAPLPAGYNRQPENSLDKNEYLLLFVPGQSFVSCNVYPQNPPELKETLEELSSHMTRTASLMEEILNQCMGLPQGFIKEFNNNRSTDFIAALRYFPATEHENHGISEHEDGNFFTFVFQDEVGGLEVLKDGKWIPVKPTRGTIVVNIGDIVQVLSNNRFKSATHRVVRKEGRSRHSYAFFCTSDGDKWIEPLPQFTKEIGEAPKYRGFFYKDYMQLRMRNKTHPPSRPEDVIHISHYAILS